MTKHALALQEKGLWDDRTKDRRVELVFIGDSEMDKEKIETALMDALLTDEEFEAFMTGAQVSKEDPFATVPSCMSWL